MTRYILLLINCFFVINALNVTVENDNVEVIGYNDTIYKYASIPCPISNNFNNYDKGFVITNVNFTVKTNVSIGNIYFFDNNLIGWQISKVNCFNNECTYHNTLHASRCSLMFGFPMKISYKIYQEYIYQNISLQNETKNGTKNGTSDTPTTNFRDELENYKVLIIVLACLVAIALGVTITILLFKKYNILYKFQVK